MTLPLAQAEVNLPLGFGMILIVSFNRVSNCFDTSIETICYASVHISRAGACRCKTTSPPDEFVMFVIA